MEITLVNIVNPLGAVGSKSTCFRYLCPLKCALPIAMQFQNGDKTHDEHAPIYSTPNCGKSDDCL